MRGGQWACAGRACGAVRVRAVINEAKHGNISRCTCTESDGSRSPGRGTLMGLYFHCTTVREP